VLAQAGLVFLGGGVGSVLRYAMVAVTDRLAAGDHANPSFLAGLPFGTLAVNVLGSLLIGVAGGLLLVGGASEDDVTQAWRLAVIVGLLGGFTTMSSFAGDAIRLVEQGRWGAALGYVVVTNAACLVAAVLGGLAAGQIAG
jgi:CrcB protein